MTDPTEHAAGKRVAVITGAGSPTGIGAACATPVGRPGTPEEVASLVAYLTGQVLVVDAGNSIDEEPFLGGSTGTVR